ncbi:MAG: hypothetical protein ACRDZ4_08670 [Egibacteraceae bacterium]
MASTDELREEAERLNREARHKDELAADLRAQARWLPDGVEAARGSIVPSVWESPTADRAHDLVTAAADAVRAGADNLEDVAKELEWEADDLRDEARQLRRTADDLDADAPYGSRYA